MENGDRLIGIVSDCELRCSFRSVTLKLKGGGGGGGHSLCVFDRWP